MKDDWTKLDTGERFRIALTVARRRGAGWIREYDNVISVGAGLRLRGAANALVNDICLCFLVRRKWADAKSRAQKIPPSILARPLVRGRRLRLWIPTDVSEFKGGAPHTALNLTDGISARVNGSPVDRGSACCLVRDANDQDRRYLMSCLHVFSAAMDPSPSAAVDCTADDATVIGPRGPAAAATGRGAVDAALVEVDSASIDDLVVWGLSPAQRATDFDLERLPERGQLFVLGRRVAPAAGGMAEEVRSTPIPAYFRAVITSPTEYDYGATAGRSFVFADTIEYIAAVRPGDSGAALVDVNGMLYGMHFYGRGEFGYAMAMPRLLDPGVFPMDLRL